MRHSPCLKSIGVVSVLAILALHFIGIGQSSCFWNFCFPCLGGAGNKVGCWKWSLERRRTTHTNLLLLALSGAIKLTYSCVPQAPPTCLPLGERPLRPGVFIRAGHRGRCAQPRQAGLWKCKLNSPPPTLPNSTHFFILFYWECSNMKYGVRELNISLQLEYIVLM